MGENITKYMYDWSMNGSNNSASELHRTEKDEKQTHGWKSSLCKSPQ